MVVHEPERIPEPAGAGSTPPEAPVAGDAAGWYVDPHDPRLLRRWDGTRWACDRDGKPIRRSTSASVPFSDRANLAYAIGVLVPFLGAVILPIPVMNATGPANGVGSLSAWEHSMAMGVLTGWGLWALALIVWGVCERVFADEAVFAYDAAARWHSSCKALAIAVAVVGVLGTLGALLLLTMTAALSGVGNSL